MTSSAFDQGLHQILFFAEVEKCIVLKLGHHFIKRLLVFFRPLCKAFNWPKSREQLLVLQIHGANANTNTLAVRAGSSDHA